MQVSIAMARESLDELIAAAEAGEEVVIARDGIPAVRLAPVKRGPFRIGILKGIASDPPADFFGPYGGDAVVPAEDDRP